jgi:Type II secretion system protein C
MPRRLLVLNAVLAILCVVFAVGIVRTLLVKHPVPPPGPAAQRAAAAPQPPATTKAGDPGLDAFAVIAAQNLFNPGRSETAVAAAVSVAKPILHGVVIHGAQSRAYLEDPTAKRVAGYSVGDTIGGGKIQKIADDRVVIARAEGLIEVLLQDPSKPRPVPAITAGASPAEPAQTAVPQAAPQQAAPQQAVPLQVGPATSTPPSNQAPAGLPILRRRGQRSDE